MQHCPTRRHFLGGLAAAGVSTICRAANAPAAPVAIAKCKTYGAELLPTLAKMFDQIGGLGRLVNNKTVVIKVNMTGNANYRLGHYPAELTHYTHPAVIGACVIGIPDEMAGERIKAYVVLKEDIKGITGYDLIKWCRQTLVSYKIPQYIEFRDMLPKSKVGKLLRREIRDEEGRRADG